jgi:hypothetical protein
LEFMCIQLSIVSFLSVCSGYHSALTLLVRRSGFTTALSAPGTPSPSGVKGGSLVGNEDKYPPPTHPPAHTLPGAPGRLTAGGGGVGVFPICLLSTSPQASSNCT